jgi:hypothetical protein
MKPLCLTLELKKYYSFWIRSYIINYWKYFRCNIKDNNKKYMIEVQNLRESFYIDGTASAKYYWLNNTCEYQSCKVLR